MSPVHFIRKRFGGGWCDPQAEGNGRKRSFTKTEFFATFSYALKKVLGQGHFYLCQPSGPR
ncbi:hypothetical protein MPNT_10328 [Candidatus Methylacidithermus pantelleriae]|uniref:Uncharacterized protein n=1 Tax=Candidatus Methylacidithermus pantelleriae TaxID=2744239 RepID=A0A8J2BJM2_9BACT|nr:hypothetical protein MPNT_10328 [Candidatus Methylacidithermus pantelleriae]